MTRPAELFDYDIKIDQAALQRIEKKPMGDGPLCLRLLMPHTDVWRADWINAEQHALPAAPDQRRGSIDSVRGSFGAANRFQFGACMRDAREPEMDREEMAIRPGSPRRGFST